MRAAGAVVAADGGGGGGGGGGSVTIASSDSSISVVEAPAGTFDLTASAATISSTGPSTVQADLDAIFGTVPVGEFASVASWAEFAALATEAPAGTWTIDQPIWMAGTIDVPVGAKVVGGENFSAAAIHNSGAVFIFDVNDSAIKGPVLMQGIVVLQNNLGASARGVELTSTMGRIPVLDRCQIIGGAEAIRVEIVGTAVISSCTSIATLRGIMIRGSVGQIAVINFGVNNGLPGHVSIEVDSSTVFSSTGGLNVSEPSLILGSGQFGFAIDDAVTLPSPSLIQISGAGNVGPQANMLRQDPGDMAFDDDRLVIKGGTSVSDWTASGIASRSDPTDPLVVNVTTINTDTTIPYEDALGNLSIVASTESHFTLFLDGGDPDIWWWEYTGSIENVTVDLALDLLVDRPSGSGLASVKWQRDVAPGYAGFADIPDSSSSWLNTNALLPRPTSAQSKGANSGDRFRPIMQNNADTNDIRIAEIVPRVTVQA